MGRLLVYRKALALKPGNRYATALEFATDVERWMADEPLVAYPDRLATRIRRFARKRPLWSLIAFQLLVIDALLLIGFPLALEVASVNRGSASTLQLLLVWGAGAFFGVGMSVQAGAIWGSLSGALAGLFVGCLLSRAGEGLKKGFVYGGKSGMIFGPLLALLRAAVFVAAADLRPQPWVSSPLVGMISRLIILGPAIYAMVAIYASYRRSR